MIRVKICGVCTLVDAQAAARAGAHAIGLNFYAKSPRCIDEAQAHAILAALPPFVEPVALFVNEPWDKILAAAHRLGLRTVQVHSDHLTPPPSADVRWIPAFPVRDAASLDAIADFVRSCSPENRPVAVLVDAHVPGQYGGTGQTPPWQTLAGFDPGVPVILAGGLTPDNVAQAIAVVRPYAVDVASGVEASPGRKDPEKIARFVKASRP